MDKNSSALQPERDDAPPVVQMQRMSFMSIVVDVARHALPLASLYVFQGNFSGYVLLTAFDLSLGLWGIVVTTRDRNDVTTVDPRSRWLVSRVLAVLVAAVMLAVLAGILAVPIGMPAYLMGLSPGVGWWDMLSQRGIWIPVAAMSLLAAVRFQGTFEARTTPGPRGAPTRKGPIIGNLEQDRKVSLAAKAAQVTLIATFAFLCYVLITFGRSGLYALPILYAVILVFYDARPDLAQRIFPKLWQEK